MLVVRFWPRIDACAEEETGRRDRERVHIVAVP